MYAMNRTKRGQLLYMHRRTDVFCDKHYPLIFICIVYWDLAFLVINPDYNYGGPKGLMNFDQKTWINSSIWKCLGINILNMDMSRHSFWGYDKAFISYNCSYDTLGVMKQILGYEWLDISLIWICMGPHIQLFSLMIH